MRNSMSPVFMLSIIIIMLGIAIVCIGIGSLLNSHRNSEQIIRLEERVTQLEKAQKPTILDKVAP